MSHQGIVAEGRYRIEKLLKKGPASHIYHAVDTGTGRPVIVKTFAADTQARGDIIRFHTEQDILSEISHPSVVRIHGHGSFEHLGDTVQYVAMEYLRGRTLEDALARGETFTIDEVIRGALGLCGALEAIHGRGIIHGDLKPENIIINGGGGAPASLTLIDFGSARLKNFDRHGPDGHIDGTFACMAPEQCGLIHAPVEEASDLYSTGVLLYRLLAGAYPFTGNSLSALLYNKISKTPAPPSRLNAEVPPVLDEIVLRLLEKEPLSRYREVSGLIHDLERAGRGERNFRTGEQDFGRVCFKAPLIGRDREIAAMEEMYREASRGRAACCMVIGEAGIGKTRILREYRKSLMTRGVLVLEGRALEMEYRETWSLFRGTIKEYLKIFQRYDDGKKDRVGGSLRRECADIGAVVTGLVPGMELILGKCPPLVALEPDRESQRFFLSLRRFLRALVAAEGEMAVFLDDLHWADEASLRLIEETMKHLSGAGVLLVASLRGGETSSRRVIGMASRLQDYRKIAVRHLRLGPLGRNDISRYLEAVLRETAPGAGPLAEYIFNRTEGNPLFTEELIRHLFQRGLLVREEGRWRFDMRRLKTADLPETMLDIIGARVAYLSEDDIAILSHAAVIGRSFRVDILMEVLTVPREGLERIRTVMGAMANAARECVVMENFGDPGMVAFTHERIREAFLRRFATAARKKLHGRIIDALELRRPDGDEDVLFDLAHHAIQSGKREKIIAYAGAAGERAMKSHAYDDAARYLGEALKALERNPDSADDEAGKNVRRTVMERYGECLVYAGRLDEGIEVFRQLLNREEDNDRKGIYCQYLALACFRNGDFNGCELHASAGLKLYGESVPVTTAGVMFGIARELLVHFLRPKFMENHLFGGEKRAKKTKVVINTYKWLLYAYYWCDGKKALRTIFRMGNLAECCSNFSEEMAEIYYHYGLLYATTGFLNKAERYCGLSKSLFEKTDNHTGLAQVLNATGLIAILRGEFEKCLKICNQGLEIIERNGNYVEICKYTQFIFLSHYLLSNYKTAREIYDRYFYINTNLFEEMMYSGSIYPFSEYIEKGDCDSALPVLEKYIKAQEEHKLCYLHALSLICLGKIYNAKGDYGRSRDIFERCIDITRTEFLPVHYINSMFPFYTEALIKEYRDNHGNYHFFRRRRELRHIKRTLRKTLRKTKKFTHHYDVALRVAAQYFHLINNKKKARHCFTSAIGKSAAMGKRYQEALTRYEYGLWLAEQNDHDRAWTQLDRAYLIFKDIDIVPYQKKILELMRDDGERRDPLRRYLDRERKDRITACIDEINRCGGYPELLETVLCRAMEIGGARSGGIFIADPFTGILRLLAHRAVDGGEFEYSRHVLEECFAGRKAVITTSAEESDEFSPYRSVSASGLKSIMCLPLRHNELTVGACYLDNSLAAGVFCPDDARLLDLFLSSASVLVENAQLCEKANRAATVPASDDAALGERHIARAVAYIEKNFTREITRGEIAREIGVSTDYLGKVFKDRTGKCIRDYISDTRVKWALDQLLNTDRKIIDIAFDAGFDSLRTFNRAFSRVMGDSPTKYRST